MICSRFVSFYARIPLYLSSIVNSVIIIAYLCAFVCSVGVYGTKCSLSHFITRWFICPTFSLPPFSTARVSICVPKIGFMINGMGICALDKYTNTLYNGI